MKGFGLCGLGGWFWGIECLRLGGCFGRFEWLGEV